METIDRYVKVGVTHFIFTLPRPFFPDEVQRFAEDVIPAVRGELARGYQTQSAASAWARSKVAAIRANAPESKSRSSTANPARNSRGRQPSKS